MTKITKIHTNIFFTWPNLRKLVERGGEEEREEDEDGDGDRDERGDRDRETD